MTDIQRKIKNIIIKVKEKTQHVFNEEQTVEERKRVVITRRHSSYIKPVPFKGKIE